MSVSFIFCVLILWMTGCGSLEYRTGGDFAASPGIYPGVRTDLNLIDWMSGAGVPSFMSSEPSPLGILILTLDIPLSAICDTPFLPYDLLVHESSPEEGCGDTTPMGLPPTCLRISGITPTELEAILDDLGRKEWKEAITLGTFVDRQPRSSGTFPFSLVIKSRSKKEIRITFSEPVICVLCVEFLYKSSQTSPARDRSGYLRGIRTEQKAQLALKESCLSRGKKVEWLTNEPPPPPDPSKESVLERIIDGMFDGIGGSLR